MPRPPRLSKRAWLGSLGGVLLAALAAGAGLCCLSQSEPGVADEAAEERRDEGTKHCSVRLAGSEPPPAPLATSPPPKSTLTMSARVPTKRIAREIDKNVPISLASAKRKPVGAAGEVTYNVTRGGFSFAVKNDRLWVTTPVSVAVSICKPLGPICPTYGTCRPKLSATVSVPLTLGSDYELGKSTASYGIAEGCSIAGTDQTGRIRGIADARLAAVKGQIDRSIPAVKPHALELLEVVTRPRALAGGGCVRVVPDDVRQAKPRLEGGEIRLEAAARGTIELLGGDCPTLAPPTMPPLSTVGAGEVLPDQSDVAVGLTMTWQRIGDALAQRARDASLDDGTLITDVRLRPGQLDGKPVVLVGVTVEGRVCGETWLSAEPTVDLARGQLRLQNMAPWGEHEMMPGLAALLASKGEVPLPPVIASATASLERFATLSPPEELQVALSVELEPATATAVPHGPGVMIVVRRRGTLAAAPE